MGLLKKQSIRLRRERWPSTDLLAEELFAIFNSDEPIEIDSPLTITAPRGTNQTPLTINQYGDNDNGIVINRAEYPPPNINLPGFDWGGAGPFTVVVYPAGPFPPEQFPDQGQNNPVPPQSGRGQPITSGGGGTPGKVLSGSGATYQVALYPAGPAGAAGETVSVTQLQIDSEATVPAGSWGLINQSQGAYYMQFPVWL